MKTENRNYVTEEQKEIKKFFGVLIILVILIFGVYFISKVLIKTEVDDLSYEIGEVATDKVIVGTMLTAPEKEYYVLAYDSTDDLAETYTMLTTYYKSNSENPIKIYYLDLNNVFNQKYYVKENSNPKATKIADLKIKNGTLIKVKNGKITEYIENKDQIKTKLKVNPK